MKKYFIFAILFSAIASLCSCSDSVSYAELLADEDMYVNNYLADQIVIDEVPADTVFITGEDAPYYRLDEDGQLYMRVLNAGTKGNMVENNELIYFRYTRWPLAAYAGSLGAGAGNNIALSPAWFRYNNFTLNESYSWGYGIQRPLAYLPIDCEVLLVVKSQMGLPDEQTSVQPYLFKLTYQRRM